MRCCEIEFGIRNFNKNKQESRKKIITVDYRNF